MQKLTDIQRWEQLENKKSFYKSPYETSNEWEKRVLCDNASRRGRGIGVTPQCYDGLREFDVTIIYGKGKYSKDSMVLCSECLKLLKKEVRRQGYRVRVTRLANVVRP